MVSSPGTSVLEEVFKLNRDAFSKCVRAGMDRAKVRGVRLGRPPVTTRPIVQRHWPLLRGRIESGDISRREAARLLGVGEASVRRLLKRFGIDG